MIYAINKVKAPMIMKFSFLVAILVGFGQAYVSGIAGLLFLVVLSFACFVVVKGIANVKI